MSTKLSKKAISLRASLAEAVFALTAEEALGNFKLSELKEQCKTFNITPIGQKLEIIERLGNYLKDFVDLPPSPEPVTKTGAKKNAAKDKKVEESLPSPEPVADTGAKKNSVKDKKEEERRVKETPTPQKAEEKRGKTKKNSTSPKEVQEVIETPAVLDEPMETPAEEVAAVDLENDEFLSAMRIVSHDEAVERLEGMKVGELRDQCKRLGLDYLKKNKAALVSMVSELIHEVPAKGSSPAERVEETACSLPKSDQNQEEAVAEELQENEPKSGKVEEKDTNAHEEDVQGHEQTEQNDAAHDKTSEQTTLPCATVISKSGSKAACLPVQAREPSRSLFSEKAKQSWMQHLQDAFLASKQEEDDCRRGSKAEHQDVRKRPRAEEADAEKEPEDCQKRQRIDEIVEDAAALG